MSPEEFLELYDYNAWANRRSVGSAEKLTSEQFTRPMGSSFSSVRDTFVHIYGAEWIWLERFQGRSPSAMPGLNEFPDLASLRETWAELDERLIAFAASLTQSGLNGVFEYRTLRFGVHAHPLWQLMLHLINHGTYHRGQATTLLRQLGAQPVLLDLMHFYRERQTGVARETR